MTATVEWDNGPLLRAVGKSTETALDATAEVLVDNTRVALSRQGVGLGRSKNAVRQIELGRQDLARVRRGQLDFGTLSKARQRRFAVAETLDRIGDVDPPGGVPRFRTGNLHRSIMQERTGPDKRKVGAGAYLPYAAIHEFGGVINHPGGQPFLIIDGRFVPLKKGRKGMGVTKPYTITMPARPYLRPSLERSRIQMRLTFEAAMKQSMKAEGY